jgi:hypothetical protein
MLIDATAEKITARHARRSLFLNKDNRLLKQDMPSHGCAPINTVPKYYCRYAFASAVLCTIVIHAHDGDAASACGATAGAGPRPVCTPRIGCTNASLLRMFIFLRQRVGFKDPESAPTHTFGYMQWMLGTDPTAPIPTPKRKSHYTPSPKSKRVRVGCDL